MLASLTTIAPGQLGIRETIARMRQIARRQAAFPIVRLTAQALSRGVGTRAADQIANLRSYLRQHTEFLRDPNGVELLQTPDYLLGRIQTEGTVGGDCDDIAMLGAALGLSVGLRARYVAIGRQGLEHIWVELASPLGGPWYDLDMTRPASGIPPAMLGDTLAVEV